MCTCQWFYCIKACRHNAGQNSLNIFSLFRLQCEHSLRVSSVLPRIKHRCSSGHIKTDQVNDELKRICSNNDSKCEFIDNSSNFTLSDRSINDALFLNDGVHLNSSGSMKLMSNLNLSLVTKVQRHGPARKSVHRRGHYGGYTTQPTHSGRPILRIPPSAGLQKHQAVVCLGCGRPGHRISHCWSKI